MSLERELETYLRNRPGWVAAGLVGRWVAIYGDEILGLYDSLDEAMRAGYDRCGLEKLFMARQIAEVDHPLRASRQAVHVPHKP